MKTEEYERMFNLEDHYWWFVGRHRLVEGYIRAEFGNRSDLTILDLGCGTGAMSKILTRWGTVISSDYSDCALNFCRRRGNLHLCAADAARAPFQSSRFDLIIALDILEHLPDDAAALKEIARLLKPNGVLMATVPAYSKLWSGHDVALMHYRRYCASEVRKRVIEAGLTVEKLTYTMTILFPLVWFFRRLLGRKGPPRATLVMAPRLLNNLLTGLLAVENAATHWVTLPFGVTVFCVARRPIPAVEKAVVHQTGTTAISAAKINQPSC